MKTVQVATAALKGESLNWAYCKAIGQTPMLGWGSGGFYVSYTPTFGSVQLNAIRRFRWSEHFGDKIKDEADLKCFVLSVLGGFVDVPTEIALQDVAP